MPVALLQDNSLSEKHSAPHRITKTHSRWVQKEGLYVWMSANTINQCPRVDACVSSPKMWKQCFKRFLNVTVEATCCPKGSINEVRKKNNNKNNPVTSQNTKATTRHVCPQQIMDDTYIYTSLTKTALWDKLSKQQSERPSDAEQSHTRAQLSWQFWRSHNKLQSNCDWKWKKWLRKFQNIFWIISEVKNEPAFNINSYSRSQQKQRSSRKWENVWVWMRGMCPGLAGPLLRLLLENKM